MPLYELIGVWRCSAPHQTAATIKTLSHSLTTQGANIRSVRILGDRILTKQLKGNDGFYHTIGRYISIIYDGHPRAFKALQHERDSKSYEIFRMQNFRVKDFIQEAVRFTKPMEEEAPFIKNKNVNSLDYAQALKVLREEKKKQY